MTLSSNTCADVWALFSFWILLLSENVLSVPALDGMMDRKRRAIVDSLGSSSSCRVQNCSAINPGLRYIAMQALISSLTVCARCVCSSISPSINELSASLLRTGWLTSIGRFTCRLKDLSSNETRLLFQSHL